MNISVGKFFAVVATLLMSQSVGHCLDSMDVTTPYETVFGLTSGKKSIFCSGPVQGSYIGGTLKKVKGSDIKTFVAHEDTLRKLKEKLAKTTNSQLRASIQKKIKALLARIKLEKSLCTNAFTQDEELLPGQKNCELGFRRSEYDPVGVTNIPPFCKKGTAPRNFDIQFINPFPEQAELNCDIPDFVPRCGTWAELYSATYPTKAGAQSNDPAFLCNYRLYSTDTVHEDELCQNSLFPIHFEVQDAVEEVGSELVGVGVSISVRVGNLGGQGLFLPIPNDRDYFLDCSQPFEIDVLQEYGSCGLSIGSKVRLTPRN